MNTKRFSIIVAAGALASMLLATGTSASGPRLEPNEPSNGLASYQIIKKELMIQQTANVVLDFEAMLFLEINTFGHGASDVAPAIPLHPDWIDGGLYDTPTIPTPRAGPVTDWPIGYTDY